ncbi:MAG: MarR family transcriptional regulator [Bacteroidota bacterium]|nr:MarR family transcriptional regulator [Bacteroidota bacterium]
MKYSFDTSLGNISRMISKSLGKSLEAKLASRDIFITAEQWSVLSILFQKKKLTQIEIGTLLGLDKVQIVRIIDILEKEKFVQRVISLTDKRFKNVNLTPKGIEIYHKIVPYAIEVHADAFSSINKDDIKQCLITLEKINDNLNH